MFSIVLDDSYVHTCYGTKWFITAFSWDTLFCAIKCGELSSQTRQKSYIMKMKLSSKILELSLYEKGATSAGLPRYKVLKTCRKHNRERHNVKYTVYFLLEGVCNLWEKSVMDCGKITVPHSTQLFSHYHCQAVVLLSWCTTFSSNWYQRVSSQELPCWLPFSDAGTLWNQDKS